MRNSPTIPQFITVDKPLTLSDGECPGFKIDMVAVGARINDKLVKTAEKVDLNDPQYVNVLFCLSIVYDRMHRLHMKDVDIILADGEGGYFLGKRSLGITPFVLNEKTKSMIDEAIQRFAEGYY